MADERTIVLYHGNCPDGFGGAYAAWKKLGDTVEYRALSYGKPVPTDLAGAHLYFIDFCYELPVMERLAEEAASFTVLDHHEGTQAVVESFTNHVYEVDHSGATIAWTYFHPETPVPLMLKYVEDGDLYRFLLPDSRALLAYLYTKPFTFEGWDALIGEIEDDTSREHALTTGRIYGEYFALLVEKMANSADLVTFEGMEVYLGSASSMFTSDLGHVLSSRKGPLALITHTRADSVRVSLRGDGTIDVAAIAQKYGGNGHPNAAGFSLPWGVPLPWTPVPKVTKDERSRD